MCTGKVCWVKTFSENLEVVFYIYTIGDGEMFFYVAPCIMCPFARITRLHARKNHIANPKKYERPSTRRWSYLKYSALFLRLGLPSTLIWHKKRSFMKTLFKPEEFENTGVSFSCGQKTFRKQNFSTMM